MFETIYVDGEEFRGLDRVTTPENQALLAEITQTLPAGTMTVAGENRKAAEHGYTERTISIYYERLPEGVGGPYSELGRWEENYVWFSGIKIGMETGDIIYKLFSRNYNTTDSPFPEDLTQMYFKGLLVDTLYNTLQIDWYAKFNTYADLVAFATSISLPVPITDENLFRPTDLVGLSLTPTGTPVRLKYYYQYGDD